MPGHSRATKEHFRLLGGKQVPQQKIQKPKAAPRDLMTVEEWDKMASAAIDSLDVVGDVVVGVLRGQVMMLQLRRRENGKSKAVEEEVQTHDAMQEQRRLEEAWDHFLHHKVFGYSYDRRMTYE